MRATTTSQRDTPVEPARVSDRAQRKAAATTTSEGLLAHSFQALMGDLSTQVVLPTEHKTAIAVCTKPTQLQRQAPDLLGVDPDQTVPITVTD